MRYTFDCKFKIGDVVLLTADRLACDRLERRDVDPDEADLPTIYVVTSLTAEFVDGGSRIGVRIAGPNPQSPTAIVAEVELEHYEESED